jgi:hypothetical protein
MAGDTGVRICGDSTLYTHSITKGVVAEEGMMLSADSLKWVMTLNSDEMRLEAAIDRRLLIREAVVRHRFSDDSLLKNWTNENGRLEMRGDTAEFVVGDKEAHVRRNVIARDAAVMVGLSAAFDEILIRRARMTGRDSVDIPTLFLGDEDFGPTAHVRFIRPDSVQIRFGEDDVIVANVTVDSIGRILSGSYQAKGDSLITIQRQRCSK